MTLTIEFYLKFKFVVIYFNILTKKDKTYAL